MEGGLQYSVGEEQLVSRAERVSLAVLLLIAGAYGLMALYFPYGYMLATYENLPGEWMQFFLFGSASVLAAINALRSQSFRLFFLALACACFFVAMEEISWGQQIFHWGSPELFQAHNLQNETNLHNIFTGPVRTPLKTALEVAVCVALVGYGVLLPLVASRYSAIARFLTRLGVAVPPLATLPFFLIAAWLELSPFNFNEAEVAELIIGSALLITTLHYRNFVTYGAEESNYRMAIGLEVVQIKTFAVVVAMAFVMTALVHAGEESQRRSAARIENGVEKFADRLLRYERWDAALALYNRLGTSTKERPSLLRRIAGIHARLGDAARADSVLQAALDYDLQRLAANPDSAAAHRSLFRTYRQLGRTGPAAQHLSLGLRLDLMAVASNPTNSAARNSLARTYSLLGQHELAKAQYRAAAEAISTTRHRR